MYKATNIDTDKALEAIDGEKMGNNPHETAAKIIRHYGTQKQLVQLMEECSELIQAASKCIRADNDYSDELVEEMADVKIMLMQFESILPEYYTQLLHDMTVYKLRRQVERMEGEK